MDHLLEGGPVLPRLGVERDQSDDGSEDNAGAFLLPDSIERAAQSGMNLAAYLADNDAYSAFARLGDLLITGPTRTNVNDFRAIIIEGR